MSHVSVAQAVIKDLDILEEACKECGLELVRNQRTYKWYGRNVGDYREADAAALQGYDVDGSCLHAIRIPGNAKAYEIGVVADKAGQGFRLLWDFYMGGFGLAEKIRDGNRGSNVNKLMRAYTLVGHRKTAIAKGLRYEERQNAEGLTVLRVHMPKLRV